MVTWQELVDEATERLSAGDVPEPERSAAWIGREATGTDAAEWLEVADRPATKRQLAAFDRMVTRREAGEPLQYVLGRWGFRSLDLFIDARVLIPRPETEVVAGAAIDELDRLGDPDGPGSAVLVDLGTGSGAIGLAAAFERPGIEVWLTDVSADALTVARANLAGIGRAGGNVRLAEGDWFAALPAELAGRIDVVVANPPYVADRDDLEPAVAGWEPMSALLADDGGTAHLVELIQTAPRWLSPRGSLVLEMAPDQTAPMAALAAGRFAEVLVVDDLAGRSRAVVARGPGTGRGT